MTNDEGQMLRSQIIEEGFIPSHGCHLFLFGNTLDSLIYSLGICFYYISDGSFSAFSSVVAEGYNNIIFRLLRSINIDSDSFFNYVVKNIWHFYHTYKSTTDRVRHLENWANDNLNVKVQIDNTTMPKFISIVKDPLSDQGIVVMDGFSSFRSRFDTTRDWSDYVYNRVNETQTFSIQQSNPKDSDSNKGTIDTHTIHYDKLNYKFYKQDTYVPPLSLLFRFRGKVARFEIAPKDSDTMDSSKLPPTLSRNRGFCLDLVSSKKKAINTKWCEQCKRVQIPTCSSSNKPLIEMMKKYNLEKKMDRYMYRRSFLWQTHKRRKEPISHFNSGVDRLFIISCPDYSFDHPYSYVIDTVLVCGNSSQTMNGFVELFNSGFNECLLNDTIKQGTVSAHISQRYTYPANPKLRAQRQEIHRQLEFYLWPNDYTHITTTFDKNKRR